MKKRFEDIITHFDTIQFAVVQGHPSGPRMGCKLTIPAMRSDFTVANVGTQLWRGCGALQRLFVFTWNCAAGDAN